MKMLVPFLAVACILCCSTSAFGELSVEDLEKIRQIVNEMEVRLGKRIDEIDTRLGKRIDEVEARLGKRIDEVETRLENRISTESEAQGKRITHLGDRITDLRERINFQGNLIIALIIAIIASVAVPMGIIVYQYNRQRDQREAEIKVLRQRIEELEGQQVNQT